MLMALHHKENKKGGKRMAGALAEKGADAFFATLEIAVAIGVAAVGVGYVLDIVFAAL
jgi:hypothetical protein